MKKIVTDRQAAGAAAKDIDRRSFLGLAAGAAAVVMGTGAAAASELPAADAKGDPNDDKKLDHGAKEANKKRAQAARKLRRDMAELAYHRPLPDHPSNGDEADYPYLGSFSKGLPHNALGEVDPAAFATQLAALASGDPADFEQVPLGGLAKLRNPLSGVAFDLEGPDSHHLAMPPAPRLDSAEEAGEAAELYWMALARNVHFGDYGASLLAADACTDLSGMSDFRGPKVGGVVTSTTLFRGNTPGDLTGPYVSQFLLRDFYYGTLPVSHRQQTTMPAPDFVTGYAEWLAIQRGQAPSGADVFDPVARYIRNGRDLASYVHFDALYEAYLNACLILLGAGAPLDPGNPYLSYAKTDAFGTFGGPHILSLVTEVATRALKAVWYQKWFVHRRLRPEAFGGRVHNHVTGAASYPLHADILNSTALPRTFSNFGTYLLPQAYPEASPLHPSYGAGHATVAGACATILKAWFDESWVIPNPVVSNAAGTALVPYGGADAGSITVGGELNKVAANVANGRNFAGIHWRTDYSESIRLGEAVAIGILEEQKATYREASSFTITKFDGTTITI